MRDADLQRIEPRHGSGGIHAGLGWPSFDPEDHHSANDESERHRHGVEEVRLDVLREKKTEHGGGNEGDDQVAIELQVHPEEARAIFPYHREHRAGLDDDVEHLPALVAGAEKVAGEDEMAGARDRQEFGQALDHAEDQGYEKVTHSERC